MPRRGRVSRVSRHPPFCLRHPRPRAHGHGRDPRWTVARRFLSSIGASPRHVQHGFMRRAAGRLTVIEFSHALASQFGDLYRRVAGIDRTPWRWRHARRNPPAAALQAPAWRRAKLSLPLLRRRPRRLMPSRAQQTRLTPLPGCHADHLSQGRRPGARDGWPPVARISIWADATPTTCAHAAGSQPHPRLADALWRYHRRPADARHALPPSPDHAFPPFAGDFARRSPPSHPGASLLFLSACGCDARAKPRQAPRIGQRRSPSAERRVIAPARH